MLEENSRLKSEALAACGINQTVTRRREEACASAKKPVKAGQSGKMPGGLARFNLRVTIPAVFALNICTSV
jgi:hypothetical protein